MEPKEPGLLNRRKRFFRAALAALIMTACTPKVEPRLVDIHLTEIDRIENLPEDFRRNGIRIRTPEGQYSTDVRYYQELRKLDQDPSVCLVRVYAPNGQVGLRRSYNAAVKPACKGFDVNQ